MRSSYRGPRTKAPLAGLTSLAVLVGGWLMAEGVRAQERSPHLPAAAERRAPVPGDSAMAVDGSSDAPLALPPARPLSMRIPAIAVDTSLMDLGLQPDGTLAAPPDSAAELAGWYQDGTTPGSVGTALTVGHLDSATGPAVFHQLGSLRRGHTIEVERADGRTAVFTVDAVELHEGDAFPDEAVYGQADRPELRVITCGGEYAGAETGYEGNTVVYAHLTHVKT
ncbi:class F sortase [Streptomyces apocyni]|uniref:class F sortase n=1 Tax=Streptomyces apocyni TaxID=2654677 RepID=UPI0012EA0237|nr:class F sortase [Streptomyces apocyni]